MSFLQNYCTVCDKQCGDLVYCSNACRDEDELRTSAAAVTHTSPTTTLSSSRPRLEALVGSHPPPLSLSGSRVNSRPSSQAPSYTSLPANARIGAASAPGPVSIAAAKIRAQGERSRSRSRSPGHELRVTSGAQKFLYESPMLQATSVPASTPPLSPLLAPAAGAAGAAEPAPLENGTAAPERKDRISPLLPQSLNSYRRWLGPKVGD